MTFPVLASLIILTLVISISIKRQSRKRERAEREFWAREHRSNKVRRKSLDGLDYITIPLETFPTHLLQEDPVVLECIGIMESLTSRKIVNFTGWSNTDLKLEYGTANITLLSEYDQNFTVLVRTLQKWADVLIAAGHMDEAAVLMEYAVNIHTDISSTYYRLAEYWISQGDASRIPQLIQTAESLRSSNGNVIVRHLKDSYPDF